MNQIFHEETIFIAIFNCNGYKVYYDDGQWKYCATNKPIEVPDGWKGRCSGDGYEKSDKMISSHRPCKACGNFPNLDGDDWCIQRLGNVMNACCGHGNRMGYIQFDNGYIIRGFFEISKENEKGEYVVVANHVKFKAMWFYIKRWIINKFKFL